MKFQIQENEIEIVNVGPISNDGDTMKRTVTFSINGQNFDRDILVSPDERTGDELRNDDFYTRNKENIDTNIIDYLSEHNLYNNK